MVDGLDYFIKKFNIKSRNVNGHKHLVLYKAVRRNFGSWWLGTNGYNHDKKRKDKGAYTPGTVVKCRCWNTDRRNMCGTGLHVGTFHFARDFARTRNLFVVEVLVKPSNVVCIPYNNEGKIRCKRLKVVRVVDKRKGP